MATVWSLNYHEVLDDARVLKQARVLAAADHDVTVFSLHPEGRPKYQDLDGFKIHRFEWSDFSKLRETDKAKFDLLKPSCQTLLDRFGQLVDQVEKTRSIEGKIARWNEAFGPVNGPVSVLEKQYFQEHSGLKRLRRKFRHMKAIRKLSDEQKNLLAREFRSETGGRPSNALLRIQKRSERDYFRELHQGKSLVFAANLLRKELVGQPDVIHAHDIYTLPAGVLLAKQYGCKLIYDAHELEIERATISDTATKFEVDALERACFEYVDALITVSDAIGEAYSERYLRREPVIVMNAPELVLNTDGGQNVSDIRAMSGLTDDVPLIVFTGGIQREHRGVDKVLQALTYLPDAHLAILGPRHERNDEWLLEFANELGVQDRVHTHAPVDARDVVATIATGSVSVIPFQAGPLNHEYAMPNKLFEAAFARIPLAVSNLKEMRRFVETLGIGRSMDQADPSSVAEAIKDILENPETYRGIVDIEKTLQDNFSWNAQAQKLTHLYEELLRSGTPSINVG